MALACRPQPTLDLRIDGAQLYDGSGAPPARGSLGVREGRIVAVGDLGSTTAARRLDAQGLALAPGFINVLSWATESLLADGRAMSDVLQGVTLEVFGEGWSMGPLSEEMKREIERRQGEIRYAVDWTSLGGYLDHLVGRGVSPNVASFVGATTVRVHVLGYENRAPTAAELETMRQLVREAMAEGALGVGSSLIYAPAFFADTEELVALVGAAAESGGSYISHLRDEGSGLLEAIEELTEIARRTGAPAQIYHLKAAGEENWPLLEAAIERVEAARAEGLRITANIYPYTAGMTGLDASMPPWVQEGGHDAWVGRLEDPAVRARLRSEIAGPSEDWENLYRAAGSPDRILLAGFKNPALRPLTGRTLADVAQTRGVDPIEAMMDLVIEDDSRVGTIYFLMSEDNVRRKLALPWVSVGSDEAAPAAEGLFLESNPHPRAYGSFARVLGRYVREEGIVPVEEAIRRMTALPAASLGLTDRGRLAPGYHADLVLFDAARIRDRADYVDPHRYAEGVRHVFVNGVQVVADGAHTGAMPGQVVRGPGFRPPSPAGD